MANYLDTTRLRQQVATRLQRDPAEIDADGLQAEYAFVLAQVLARFPCLGDLSGLTAADLIFLETALALMLAARLYGPLLTGAGGAILSTTTAAGSKIQFAPIDPKAAELWMAEAQADLARVSCISAGYQAQSASVHLLAVAGRRRAQQAQYPYNLMASGQSWGLGLLDYGLYPLLWGGI